MLPEKHKRNLYFYQMSWSTNSKLLSVVLFRFIDIIHEGTFMLGTQKIVFHSENITKENVKFVCRYELKTAFMNGIEIELKMKRS